MARLLQGILPIEMGDQVLPDTYNRAIRSLELSLNKFDPTKRLLFWPQTGMKIYFKRAMSSGI